MPILSNPRHEAFAQALAKGMSASEAYIAAGYNDSRSSACRLSTNANVVDRVAEIQAKVAEKAEWSAADRIAMLQRIAEANLDDDPRVTVSAISEANKMCGTHAPAKQEITGKDGGAIQTHVVVDEKTVESAITKLRGL